MNPSLIDRLEIQSESSVRHSAYNHKSGKKQRATAKYWKNETARSRRKGENTRIRQQRREEIRLEYQPSEDDIYLENIHFANFLGCKDGTVRYNTPNNHQDNVCLSECDDILCLWVKESEPSNRNWNKNHKMRMKMKSIQFSSVNLQVNSATIAFRRKIGNTTCNLYTLWKRRRLVEKQYLRIKMSKLIAQMCG